MLKGVSCVCATSYSIPPACLNCCRLLQGFLGITTFCCLMFHGTRERHCLLVEIVWNSGVAVDDISNRSSERAKPINPLRAAVWKYLCCQTFTLTYYPHSTVQHFLLNSMRGCTKNIMIMIILTNMTTDKQKQIKRANLRGDYKHWLIVAYFDCGR